MSASDAPSIDWSPFDRFCDALDRALECSSVLAFAARDESNDDPATQIERFLESADFEEALLAADLHRHVSFFKEAFRDPDVLPAEPTIELLSPSEARERLIDRLAGRGRFPTARPLPVEQADKIVDEFLATLPEAPQAWAEVSPDVMRVFRDTHGNTYGDGRMDGLMVAVSPTTFLVLLNDGCSHLAANG